MIVKSKVKAGRITFNHNQGTVRAGGLRVRSTVKAGGIGTSPGR